MNNTTTNAAGILPPVLSIQEGRIDDPADAAEAGLATHSASTTLQRLLASPDPWTSADRLQGEFAAGLSHDGGRHALLVTDRFAIP